MTLEVLQIQEILPEYNLKQPSQYYLFTVVFVLVYEYILFSAHIFFNPVGITHPSLAAQKDLLEKAYKSAQIDPTTLAYLEAHGTGKSMSGKIA